MQMKIRFFFNLTTFLDKTLCLCSYMNYSQEEFQNFWQILKKMAIPIYPSSATSLKVKSAAYCVAAELSQEEILTSRGDKAVI